MTLWSDSLDKANFAGELIERGVLEVMWINSYFL